ncbi:hypothetical protein ACOSP7_011889 [Xanthoceras sorbifolium]
MTLKLGSCKRKCNRGLNRLLGSCKVTQGNSSSRTRPLLSTSIDLSQILLDSMYDGFSAATGTRATVQVTIIFLDGASTPSRIRIMLVVQYLDGEAIPPNINVFDIFKESNEASSTVMSISSLLESSTSRTMCLPLIRSS